MKKAITIFLCVVVFILLFSLMVVGIYEIHNKSMQDDLSSYYTCAVNNFYIDESTSISDVETLDSFVETLPSNFIKEFRKDWKVIIEDKIPAPEEWPDNVLINGYTDWNSRLVLIRNRSDSSEMLNSFVHELGHCFDLEYGSVSHSYLFSDFYELYKDDFNDYSTSAPPGYSTSSTDEFFATCFKEYLLHPEHLKEVAPKSYIFIDCFYKDVEEMKRSFTYDLGTVANTLRRLANLD